METVEDGHCFVCGTLNPLGFKAVFQVDKEKGRATSRLVIPDGFQGWQNVVHGGIIATLLDEVAIYACRNIADQVVTAELNVRFRKPVTVGSEVTLMGEVVEQRKRVFTVRAQLELDGTVHAEADARIVRL